MLSTAYVFLVAIGATIGVALVMLGFALFAKRLFFEQSEGDGY